MILLHVDNNLKKIRNERGIKQIKMAEDLQVTRQTITAIENCKYNPGLELSLKIAEYFDLSVHDIFRLKDSAEPNQ